MHHLEIQGSRIQRRGDGSLGALDDCERQRYFLVERLILLFVSLLQRLPGKQWTNGNQVVKCVYGIFSRFLSTDARDGESRMRISSKDSHSSNTGNLLEECRGNHRGRYCFRGALPGPAYGIDCGDSTIADRPEAISKLKRTFWNVETRLQNGQCHALAGLSRAAV